MSCLQIYLYITRLLYFDRSVHINSLFSLNFSLIFAPYATTRKFLNTLGHQHQPSSSTVLLSFSKIGRQAPTLHSHRVSSILYKLGLQCIRKCKFASLSLELCNMFIKAHLKPLKRLISIVRLWTESNSFHAKMFKLVSDIGSVSVVPHTWVNVFYPTPVYWGYDNVRWFS